MPKGTKIFNLKWVDKIKRDEFDKFMKMNPRLCLIGTSMDQDIYETFANYMRMSSFKMIAIIIHVYKMFRFQIDDENAFQNTPVNPDAPKIITRQPPGFVKV